MKTCIRLLFVVAVLLAVGCSRLGRTAEEMRQTIVCADSMNQAYVPMDSLAERLQAAADYYDRFGTANEQVRAHYLLGCVYRDRGEAPEALQHYHDAADRADTTATDCDFSLLARVHGQMAELFEEQLMPNEMLAQLKNSGRYAQIAMDTLVWLRSNEYRYYAYYLNNQPDSAIIALQHAIGLYKHYKHEQYSIGACGLLADAYVKTGQYEKAKPLFDMYESDSGHFDSFGNIEQGREVYYYSKGLYYLGIGDIKTAERLFRKELSSATDVNNQEAGFHGLYLLYDKLHIPDSVAKYASLTYQMSEKRMQESSILQLRHMQSLYNYSRNEIIAKQKTVEASRYRHLVFILLFLFVSVIIIVSVIIYAARLKKQAEINHREQEYQHHVEQLEKTMNDALKLKESHFHELLCQKEADINLLQKKISGYELAIGHETTIDERLVNTDIYHHLKYVLTHPKENMEKADWDALTLTINKLLPDFYAMMHARASISVDEYHICMLVRLYFSPADIARFIGLSRASITTKRQELLRKVFGQEGKARQFDQMVRRIGRL